MLALIRAVSLCAWIVCLAAINGQPTSNTTMSASTSVIPVSDGNYYIAAAPSTDSVQYLSLYVARDYALPISGMILAAIAAVLTVIPTILYGLMGLPLIIVGTDLALFLTVSMGLSIPNSKTLSLKEDRAVRWAVHHPENATKVHPEAFIMQNVWEQTKYRRNMTITMKGRGTVKRLSLHKKDAMPIIAIQSSEFQDLVYLQFLGRADGKPDLWLYLKRGEVPALHETKRDLWRFVPVE